MPPTVISNSPPERPEYFTPSLMSRTVSSGTSVHSPSALLMRLISEFSLVRLSFFSRSEQRPNASSMSDSACSCMSAAGIGVQDYDSNLPCCLLYVTTNCYATEFWQILLRRTAGRRSLRNCFVRSLTYCSLIVNAIRLW